MSYNNIGRAAWYAIGLLTVFLSHLAWAKGLPVCSKCDTPSYFGANFCNVCGSQLSAKKTLVEEYEGVVRRGSLICLYMDGVAAGNIALKAEGIVKQLVDRFKTYDEERQQKELRDAKLTMGSTCSPNSFCQGQNGSGAVVSTDKIERAKKDVAEFAAGFITYFLITKRKPSTLRDLVTPLEDGDVCMEGGENRLKDPWGKAYALYVVGKSREVVSAGPDGEFGTGDDIRKVISL